MNKTVLAHLHNLSEKASKGMTSSWANYKPVSPFKTNKIKRIDEKINDNNRLLIENLIKQSINEELY